MICAVKRTIPFIAITLLGGMCLADTALAQNAPVMPREPKAQVEPKDLLLKNVPDGANDRKELLRELYERLSKSEDDESSKVVASAIEKLWLRSGSDTVDLLMNRVGQLMQKEEFDVALTILNSVVEIAPNYPEAWNRRAAVFFLKKDYGKSLENLRSVLAIDPSHYKAIQGLGLLMQEIGEKKGALKAYREALKIYPYLDGVRQAEEELAREIEGQGI